VRLEAGNSFGTRTARGSDAIVYATLDLWENFAPKVGLVDDSEILKYGVNIRRLSNTAEAFGVGDSAGRLNLMRMQCMIRSNATYSKYYINQLSLAPY
jgi:hypothetical protein